MAASTHQPGRAELDPAGELLGKPVPGENFIESHLAHMFRATVANHGFRPATRVRQGGQWIIRTYAETGRRVAGLARAFVTPGCSPRMACSAGIVFLCSPVIARSGSRLISRA